MIVTIALDVALDFNNGTSIAAYNLIHALKENGHTVRVICPDENYRGEEGYYICGKMNLWPVNGYLKKNEVILAKPDRDLIEKALEGADVLHIIVPFAISNMAIKIAKEKNIKITAGFHCQAENITAHLFLKNSKLINHIIYKLMWKKTYQYVDAIHFPTQFIKNVFESNINRITNGYVISNGVGSDFEKISIEKPQNLKDKFVILYIGRYSKEKAHRHLLKAIRYSKHKNDIQLILAGTGPTRDKIIKYSRKYLVNMPIMKLYTHLELLNVINYSDLYVHSAEVEIEAIGCLEAIKCGLVPIINNSPKSAAKYFALNEDNLFNYNDSLDLANKIDYWIEHKKEREECSKEYLGFTKEFDRVECMKQMIKMMEEIRN